MLIDDLAATRDAQTLLLRMISQDASLFQYRVKNETYQVVDVNLRSPQTGVFLVVQRPKSPAALYNAFLESCGKIVAFRA